MSLKTTIIIFLGVYLLSIQNSYANQNIIETKFIPATTYSTKNGLPSNNIQDIIEDDNGFLWLGTQKGLSRFDSNQFKNFQKDKSDPYSLPNILVEELMLMPNGKIWMSINEVGITILDKYEQQFSSIKNDSSELFNMPNSNLYGMATDKNNNAWFSIYGEGIYQWDSKQNEFIKHLQSNKQAWLTSKKTFEILIDQKNRLWVCTIDSMVYMYDINTEKSKSFNFAKNSNDPLSSPIYGFTESANGTILAGGYSGVYTFNEKLEKFDILIEEQQLTDIYAGQHTSVRRLLMDSKNNLWIGTTRSLLQLSNSKLQKIRLYENGEVIQSDWPIHSMIEGYDGNIWIGTEGRGLFKLAPDWDRYNIYLSPNKDPIDLRRAYQYKETIWLAHPSSKMTAFKFVEDQMIQTHNISPDLGEEYIRIDSIYQEHPDYLWLSSIHGIHKINTHNGESQMVKSLEGKKLGSVRIIHKANGRFYFNLFSEEKIAYFEEPNMTAKVITNKKENQMKGKLIHQISEGLDEQLWVASNYGIESLNLENHHFSEILAKPEKLGITNFFLSGNDVWYISDGSLYKNAWDGKQLLEAENKYANILPLIKFFEIKRLKDNIMLISSEDNGLIELNVNTLEHKVYTTENGLPSDVIINLLFPNQVPIIVTEAGVAIYNQKFKEIPRSKPKLVIDEIFHGDKRVSIVNNKTLDLKYNYGSINFDVALLSYTNSRSIEYQYQLDGITNDWIHTGNDDSYTFLNLKSGDYTFRARGRSNYGLWSDQVSYSLHVAPAPWRSFWAYLIYAFIFLCLILWLSYIYKRKRRYEYEIIKQQTQKQIAHEASKAKSDFLARVSHEVRTPLNGVLGMGELMLDTNMDEEQQIYAETILTSGKHLLETINDILDLSKIEAGKLELELQNFDLLKLVDEIVLSFTSQTKQSDLLFIFLFDPNLIRHRTGDIIRLKQILFNLLSNAFKFTKKGQVILNLSSSIDPKTIDVKVSDTGIGLNPKAADDLFKPFVQADPTVTRKYGGTGLGLSIVKQLVEKMDGFIEVNGAPGQGSVFHFQVQLETSPKESVMSINSQHESIALIISNKNLQLSISNYLTILNQNFTKAVTNNTTLIITDATELKLNSKADIETLTINTKNKQAHRNIIHSKNSLSLPITFKKIKEICQGKYIKPLPCEKSSKPVYIVSQKILYVEDNVINQYVGIEMIEKMGHLIDVVDNVNEAMIMLNRNSYDLLLVDYHLPLKNGISLIKNWENSRNIPILVITADLTDEVYQNCQKLKVKQIVSKPFSQIQLHDAIESAFDE